MLTFLDITHRLQDLDIAVLKVFNQHRIHALDGCLIPLTDTVAAIAWLIPMIILLTGFCRKQADVKRAGWQAYLSLTISAIAATIVKYSVNRTRPFVGHPFIEKLSTGGSPSFPSGHTADAFATAVALTLIVGKKPAILIALWL